jgi:drug/metabolite transporter (DMT)-like permease
MTWSVLVTLGVVHTGLAFTLMYDAVQRLPTHLQGALSFIYPVVALLVDVFAVGNLPTTLQIAGMAVILAAGAGIAGLFARVYEGCGARLRRGTQNR